MNEGSTEMVAGLLSCMSWIVALMYVAMGIIGLVRLKTTPAGLLIGGGLIAYALVTAVKMLVRSFLLTPEALMDSPDPMRAYGLFRVASNCSNIFFILILAVGFALLPSSLTKLDTVKLGVRGD